MIIVWYFDRFTICTALTFISNMVLPLSGSIKTTGPGNLSMSSSTEPFFNIASGV
jgi:hypothetical protein